MILAPDRVFIDECFLQKKSPDNQSLREFLFCNYFIFNQLCDLAGIRTQDPILKRDVLYQLSYQIINFEECKSRNLFLNTKGFQVFCKK
jgi:competence protein ComGF